MEQRKRVFSARPVQKVNRARPFSAIQKQPIIMVDNMDRTYFQQANEVARRNNGRPISGKKFHVQTKEEKVYKGASIDANKRDQMMEELIKSKQTVNKLVEQLTRERQKSERIRRKSQGYSNMLGGQFQNQDHWKNVAVNNHLVAGIKAMYFKLKQDYEKLQKSHQQMEQSLNNTELLERQIEIKILHQQNQELSKKVQELQKISRETGVMSQTHKEAQAYVIIELENYTKKLQEKVKTNEIKYAEQKRKCQEKERQLQFQEKLVIEKQNEKHSTNLKNKRLVKENHQLKAQIKYFEEQKFRIQKEFQTYKVQSLEREDQLKNNARLKIEQMFAENKKKIETLQRKNYQFQEVSAEYRRKNIELQGYIEDLKEEKKKKAKNRQETQVQERIKTMKNGEGQKEHEEIDNMKTLGKRVQQRADKKHSQQSQKKRRVKQSQVEGIAELIKYKLKVQGISLEKFKNGFNFNGDQDLEDDQKEWSSEYMTMKQVIEILRSSPLNLGEENAFILGRYLIEDVEQDWIYCDFQNQNIREKIKSTLKTLIGSYKHQLGNYQQEMNKILSQYGPNLLNTLNTLEPSGYVSKTKFQGILKSLVEVKNQILELLIGKMALEADNIGRLPYKVLF